MLRNRHFSLTLATCLIVLTAFVVGCSMESSNPMNTDTATPGISAKPGGGNGGTYDGSAYAAYPFDPILFRKRINARQRTDTALITVENGGKLTVDSGGAARIRIQFPPNSVPYDVEMTATLMDPEGKAIDFEVTPSLTLNEPAKITVKGDVLVPVGGTDLYHHGGGDAWDSVVQATVENYDTGKYLVKANTRFNVDHFSRYAFGSRF